jgi:hypothetical protein
MGDQGLEFVAQQWIDAFHLHDIDKLLALYRDDARHYSPRVEERSPETKGWLSGKAQLREWWQSSFDSLPGLDYELRSMAVNPPDLFLTYIRHAPEQPDMEVMEYLKIEEGLIVESRVLRSWVM